MPSQYTGVAVEGKLAVWLLGTGIQRRGEAAAEWACLGQSWVWRNFLTLSRVILDKRCMAAVSIWDVVLLPCLLSLARWPALGREESSKVKGSSEEETRWGGGLTHPGARGRELERETVTPILTCLPLRPWGGAESAPFP